MSVSRNVQNMKLDEILEEWAKNSAYDSISYDTYLPSTICSQQACDWFIFYDEANIIKKPLVVNCLGYAESFNHFLAL